MTLGRFLLFIFLLWVCIYTASYGVWTWRQKNRFGAVGLFILTLAVLGVPIFALYFRS